MEPVLSGGCQCGAVRYALFEVPPRTSLCHCRMCQKAVGQPFAAYATVAEDKFAWTRGAPPAWKSSTAAERHFCPLCGTSLTFRYFHKPQISVAVGTLDHPERVTPVAHVGVEGRLPWMAGAVLDALPGSTTEGPNTPAPIRDLTNFQHPDHDTPDGWAPPAP
jgi:hypothetical protein